MKKIQPLNSTLFLWISVLFAENSFGENYTRWGLPEGAQARLGKGHLTWSDRAVVFSPDGTRLAVSSSIGTWLYDTDTNAEVALLPGSARSAVFSPDGSSLANRGRNGAILLWDPDTGQLKATIDRYKDHWVNSMAFSPDGATLASAGRDSTIRFWDVSSGQSVAILEGHTDGVRSVAFSADGTTLASVSYDNKTRLWDVASGQLTTTLRGKSVAFSPDGSTLAVANRGEVQFWDVASGNLEATLEGHTRSVESVAYSPDGTTLAIAGGWDRTIRLWDVSNGHLKATLKGPTNVQSVAYSPDGITLAIAGIRWDGDRDMVLLWNVLSKPQAVLEGHTNWVSSVAFSPKNSILASADKDGTIRLWDVEGQSEAILEGNTDWVRSVAFSADGATLASASEDGTIMLWDVVGAQPKYVLEGHADAVYVVAFSGDGAILASAGADNSVRLWEAANGRPKATLRQGDAVYSVAFSPDNSTLAIASRENPVQLWDIASGIVTTLKGHELHVYSVAFSPDGATLASGGFDRTVRLWDVASGQSRYVLEGHEQSVFSVAFSPDGGTLASASEDKMVRLWDVASGESKASLYGHGHQVLSVAFSQDGTLLASASRDNTVRLWRWKTAGGKFTKVLEGHAYEMGSVAFSRDGSVLSGGGELVGIWEAATGRLKTNLEGSGPWSFSPDGTTVAGDSLNAILIYETTGGQLEHTLEKPYPREAPESLMFSPDGAVLAGIFDPGGVFLWELGEGRSIHSHELSGSIYDWVLSSSGTFIAGRAGRDSDRIWLGEKGNLTWLENPERWEIGSLAFSPDETILAAGGQAGTILLWDVGNKQIRKTLEGGHTNLVVSLAFNPDGRILASASKEGTIRLWDVGSQQLQTTLEADTDLGNLIPDQKGDRSLTFSRDGTSLVYEKPDADSRKEGTVWLWEASSGQLMAILKQSAWSFSPDGTILASGGRDGSVKLWDPISGQLDATLQGHNEVVTSLAFSHDGTTLGSASRDGSVLLWGMSPSTTPPPGSTAVEPWRTLPLQTALLHNYPNPFNPETWIPYQLQEAAVVHLRIYDVRGALVREIDLGFKASGRYLATNRAAHWDGRDQKGMQVASGVYFCRFQAGPIAQVRKMVVLK